MNDKQSNADRIRNMSDEELAEWITNMCDIESTKSHSNQSITLIQSRKKKSMTVMEIY